MKDQLISFDVAKLAKEKGFKEYCIAYFSISGEEMYFREDGMYFHSNGANGRLILRPTQSLLQKWLREEHGIIVLADYGFVDDSTDAYCWSITTFNTESKSDFDRLITIQSLSEQFRDWYENYEEAIEEGLLKALQMIK